MIIIHALFITERPTEWNNFIYCDIKGDIARADDDALFLYIYIFISSTLSWLFYVLNWKKNPLNEIRRWLYLLKTLPKQVLKFLGPSLTSEPRQTTLNVIQLDNCKIGISFFHTNVFEVVDSNACKKKTFVSSAICKSYMFCSVPNNAIVFLKRTKKEL